MYVRLCWGMLNYAMRGYVLLCCVMSCDHPELQSLGHPKDSLDPTLQTLYKSPILTSSFVPMPDIEQGTLWGASGPAETSLSPCTHRT